MGRPLGYTYPPNPNTLRAKTRRSFVYAMCHPVTLVPFYVGVTSNMNARWTGHLSEASRRSKYSGELSFDDKKAVLIRKLAREGLMPTMVVLEVTTIEKEREAENRWAMSLAAKGHKLVNKRQLEVCAADRLKSLGICHRLVELSEIAADILESSDCESNKVVARKLRRVTSEARSF